MKNTLSSKIGIATKWSSITEICAKLVSPVSSAILARLLAPEAFGVVATINVIISFAEIFTDAGFQKYLIQHEFKDEVDQIQSATVAFWTNLFISLFIWGIIACFRKTLAAMVGNPDLGNVIVIACMVLPMASFSSIQMALFKRIFDFKTLFYARLVGVLIPIFVTVPLAIITHSYWALICGTIIQNLSNAFILTVRSSWKPSLFYSFSKLKEMFSFSMWTLLEQISIWLTSYIGTFIIGVTLSSYYVGLYKTTLTTVNGIINLITSATTPVLFSALSRLQENDVEFKQTYFRFQRWVSLLIVPLSAGIFLYRKFVTSILLGSQWTDATMFLGLWGLTSCAGVLFNNYSSEVYRSIGKPKISLAVQLTHLAFLIPSLIIASQHGFTVVYWTRSLIRFQMYITQMLFLFRTVKISFLQILKNIYPSIIGTGIMSIIALLLQRKSNNFVWSLLSVFVCVFTYFITIMVFPEIRRKVCFLYRKCLLEMRHIIRSKLN